LKRDYRVYVYDILDAIRKIEKYSTSRPPDELLKDEMAIDAIVRNFEVIGEATKHIPEIIRRKYPAVPWKMMSGMRDKLIHEYFGINSQVLLITIKEDLPVIKPQIEALSSELDKIKEDDRS
jgi:uncharacterized protein with HEPN domain